MRASDLRQIFDRILLASLAAAPASALAGCFVSVAPVDPAGDAASDAPRADVATDVAYADAAPDDGPPWLGCPVVTTGDAPDGAVSCMATVTWSCGPPSEVAEGNISDFRVCQRYCPQSTWGSTVASCSTTGGDGAPVELVCYYCAAGRRSEGLAEPDVSVPGAVVASFLANAATLEAASVTAFERLHGELSALGAPAELLADLLQAAEEERDHAERVALAARERGAEPAAPRFDAARPRSLFEIARENAVEGCVRETLGALVAAWQARTAADAGLAGLFARLARDEASHAALSWRLDAWISSRLPGEQRRAVARARREAVDALARNIDADVAPACELVREAGLPDAAAARRLLRGLEHELWPASA